MMTAPPHWGGRFLVCLNFRNRHWTGPIPKYIDLVGTLRSLAGSAPRPVAPPSQTGSNDERILPTDG